MPTDASDSVTFGSGLFSGAIGPEQKPLESVGMGEVGKKSPANLDERWRG